MKTIEETISGFKGVKLYTKRTLVDNPKAAVLIVHGYCEHCGRYSDIVETFLQAGYHCFLYDQRGHGNSEGRRAAINEFSEYLEDLNLIYEKSKKEAEGLPFFLLGHSMGGLAVSHFVLQYKPVLDGVVLSSPYLGLKIDLPLWKNLGGRIMSVLVPSLSLKSDIDPHLLSHDEKVVEEYIADPNVSKIANARFFTESLAAQEFCLKNAEQWNTPALVMHGGDDRIADPDKTREFFKRMNHPNSKLVIYDGLYHEIFNELDAKSVIDEMMQWLEAKR